MAGPGIANFYNIYDPAQGTLNGLLSIPEFANPVQFICGGSFETAGGPRAPEYFRRAEICRERLGPVLRRLTANYPPIMFHPLNTITAYKGQIIYDTPATQAKAQTPIPQLTWIPRSRNASRAESGGPAEPARPAGHRGPHQGPRPAPAAGAPPGCGPAPGQRRPGPGPGGTAAGRAGGRRMNRHRGCAAAHWRRAVCCWLVVSSAA